MPVRDLEVSSLEELVKSVVALRRPASPKAFLWYRGVDSDQHKLLPKLLRENQASDAIFEREARLITRFRQRGYAYWPAGYPQDDWEQLFAMQHHGLPTRLLDWSENLFVAAYFALNGKGLAASKKGGPVPTVWVIDPAKWNQSMPGLSEYGSSVQVLTTADDDADRYRPNTSKKRPMSPVAIYGTHNSARIVAQRGTFVVWGADTKPLEEIPNGSLTKIRLTGDRETMRQELRFIGFTETMIFPEMTSLATELTEAEGWRQ